MSFISYNGQCLSELISKCSSLDGKTEDSKWDCILPGCKNLNDISRVLEFYSNKENNAKFNHSSCLQ